LLASINGIKFGHSGNLAFGSGNSGLVTSGISGLVKSRSGYGNEVEVLI
jgi:hypothetical protein